MSEFCFINPATWSNEFLKEELAYCEEKILALKKEIERRAHPPLDKVEKALLTCGLNLDAIQNYRRRNTTAEGTPRLKAALDLCNAWLEEHPGRIVLPED